MTALQPTDSASRPLRVAMVVNGFPLPSETFVVNQAVGLLQRGHEVDLYALASRRDNPAALHADVVAHRLIERTRYAAARPRDGLRFLWHGAVAAARVLRHRPSALWHTLHLPRYREQAWCLRLLQHAGELRKGRRYDVIHAQFGDVGHAMLALRASGLLSGALVTSFRGADLTSFVRHRGEAVYRPLFDQGDAFFTNCAYFQQRLLAMGCPAPKLEVLYSGIDTRRFPHREHDYTPARPLRLVTVGRLVGKKGVADAIEAVARCRAAGLAVHYTIVGDGPLRDVLQNQAQHLGLAQQVHFAGAASSGDVMQALMASDVFLGPSVTAASGDQDAPINTLKEAMAVGLPVIATRHGGIPELVEHGVSGLLVPERDPSALAQAIGQLAASRERWPSLVHAGRAVLHDKFNLDARHQQLVALYRKAIAHHAAQQPQESTCKPLTNSQPS